MRLLLLLLLAAPARAQERQADLILWGGKVFLGPGRFAEAAAVTGNRVSAVGTTSSVRALRGPKTRFIDLRGRAVTPGFHDAHVHFMKGALFLTQVDLNGSVSVSDVQERVKAYIAKNPGLEWVVGRGWDHTAFPDRKYPTRQDLDVVSSSRPIALTDVDAHKLWLNTEALRRTGIVFKAAHPTASKPINPNILRDEDGYATGVLLEDAMKIADKIIPKPSREEKLAALRRALALAREAGVTAVESLPGPVDTPAAELLDLWKVLNEKGEFTMRFFLYGRLEEASDFAALRPKAAPYPRSRLDLIGVKGFVDGVLSDRTAALLAPYFDEPKISGEPKYSLSKLSSLVRAAHALGLQAALHAIGDRAVREALDACQRSEERAKEDGTVLPAVPCRVEHIEEIDAADVPRFKALGIAASMQPSHMTYDNEEQNYNPNRLGGRVQLSFAWRSLEEAGALLAFGTDWPVMPLLPRIALFAATTRQHFNGRPPQGWIPKQKITLENAVEHYTLGSARAIGKDAELGSIAPGKLADLVVWDGDLFSVSGLDLLKVRPDMTVFDGRVVFERKP